MWGAPQVGHDALLFFLEFSLNCRIPIAVLLLSLSAHAFSSTAINIFKLGKIMYEKHARTSNTLVYIFLAAFSSSVWSQRALVPKTFYVGTDTDVYANTPAEAMAASLAFLNNRTDGITVSGSNIRPTPDGYGYYYTANGVPKDLGFDIVFTFPDGSQQSNHWGIGSIRFCPGVNIVANNAYFRSYSGTTAVEKYSCRDLTIDTPNKCMGTNIGNPLNVESRRKVERHVDWSGTGALSFERTYNSSKSGWGNNYSTLGLDLSQNSFANLQVTPKVAGGRSYDYTLPNGVTGNYLFPFLSDADAGYTAGTQDLSVVMPDGEMEEFSGDGLTLSLGSADRAEVVKDASAKYMGFRRISSDGKIESFDVAGHLISLFDINGSGVALTYLDSSGHPTMAGMPACNVPPAGSLGTGLPACGTDVISGRQLNFYYAAGLLSKLFDPAGMSIDYSYTNGNLTEVKFEDGSQLGYSYNESTYTAGANLPNALTGITDEFGKRFATFNYNSDGSAYSSEHSGGVFKYTLDPGVSPDATDNYSPVTVLDPLGTTRSYNRNLLKLQLSVQKSVASLASTGVDQPGGAGCNASSSNIIYDANANVVSRDDFNGYRACFATDLTRNLRTVAVEGLPAITGNNCPANFTTYAPQSDGPIYQQRKTTAVWHPDWVLKTREAVPKKITTWVYNGQPDPIAGNTANCAPITATLPDGKPIAVLCARYEQATTDPTGALGLSAAVSGATSKWSYSYNQNGQLLTSTTPKQSSIDKLSHTTTYVYFPTTSFSGQVGHAVGDLNSVTNPMGQMTTFNYYDKSGRLLSSTDPNGTVTTQTYFQRGWLQSQIVTPVTGGALATSYDYWPTGLLKSATLPDASTLNYIYDDAHRLTDVVDGAGNKLHYVLDNAGNRVSEQVSDASGNLASNVGRVFDALNRVQSSTGVMQ